MRALALTGVAILLLASTSHAQREGEKRSSAERWYRLSRHTDEFTRATYSDLAIRSENVGGWMENRCTNLDDSDVASTAINLRRFEPRAGDAEFLLNVTYYGSDWLFIREHAGVYILAGDSVLTPALAAPPARDVAGQIVVETAWIPVDRELLSLVARSAVVKMRLDGERGNCDFMLRRESLELVRLFVEREMAPVVGPLITPAPPALPD